MQFGQVYCNAFVLALCSCLLIICIACRMIGNNQNNNLNEFNNHINNNYYYSCLEQIVISV